jgi:predicted permease
VSRVNLVTVINEDASPRGAARGRMRTGLVVAQVAVSLTLLVGAGLVSRSVAEARRVDPGFDPKQVTAIALDVRQNGYDASRGRVFFRKLLDSARSDHHVESATLAEHTPLNMLETPAQRVTVDGYEPQRGEDVAFSFNVVASEYFRTLRMPLIAGRPFEDGDNETARPVVIVNRTFAERFWDNPAAAIGKRLRVRKGDWRTVVGVVADTKYARFNEAPRPYFYLPFFQAYRPQMFLHTRGSGPVEHLVEQASADVTAVDPDLPVLSARPLTDSIRGAFIFLDLAVTMLLIFGTAGMVLAAMGTYGLVSYAVKQSTHEIGIRMALGASRIAVVRQFVMRGLRLGAIGASLGIVAALGASRLIGSVLFGVSTTDTISFLRALAVVLTGVLVATLVPAWRAARTNPFTALRHQ